MALTEEAPAIPPQEFIDEAIVHVDRGLGDMLHRELVSTLEVGDLLLDIRSLVAAARDASDQAQAFVQGS